MLNVPITFRETPSILPDRPVLRNIHPGGRRYSDFFRYVIGDHVLPGFTDPEALLAIAALTSLDDPICREPDFRHLVMSAYAEGYIAYPQWVDLLLFHTVLEEKERIYDITRRDLIVACLPLFDAEGNATSALLQCITDVCKYVTLEQQEEVIAHVRTLPLISQHYTVILKGVLVSSYHDNSFTHVLSYYYSKTFFREVSSLSPREQALISANALQLGVERSCIPFFDVRLFLTQFFFPSTQTMDLPVLGERGPREVFAGSLHPTFPHRLSQVFFRGVRNPQYVHGSPITEMLPVWVHDLFHTYGENINLFLTTTMKSILRIGYRWIFPRISRALWQLLDMLVNRLCVNAAGSLTQGIFDFFSTGMVRFEEWVRKGYTQQYPGVPFPSVRWREYLLMLVESSFPRLSDWGALVAIDRHGLSEARWKEWRVDVFDEAIKETSFYRALHLFDVAISLSGLEIEKLFSFSCDIKRVLMFRYLEHGEAFNAIRFLSLLNEPCVTSAWLHSQLTIVRENETLSMALEMRDREKPAELYRYDVFSDFYGKLSEHVRLSRGRAASDFFVEPPGCSDRQLILDKRETADTAIKHLF